MLSARHVAESLRESEEP